MNRPALAFVLLTAATGAVAQQFYVGVQPTGGEPPQVYQIDLQAGTTDFVFQGRHQSIGGMDTDEQGYLYIAEGGVRDVFHRYNPRTDHYIDVPYTAQFRYVFAVRNDLMYYTGFGIEWDDALTGDPVGQISLTGDLAPFESIDFRSDGRLIASSGRDLYVIDLETGVSTWLATTDARIDEVTTFGGRGYFLSATDFESAAIYEFDPFTGETSLLGDIQGLFPSGFSITSLELVPSPSTAGPLLLAGLLASRRRR